jgi:LAO/AO transport system kinase
MLGLRSGATMRAVPAHHGVDLKTLAADEREAVRQALNPARAARAAAAAEHSARWTPPVLATVAARDEGIGEVLAALDRHGRYLV